MTTLQYFTPNITDVTDYIFSRAVQSDPLKLRTSVDGTKNVLKFTEGNVPYSLIGQDYGPYTQAGVVVILAGAEWTVDP